MIRLDLSYGLILWDIGHMPWVGRRSLGGPQKWERRGKKVGRERETEGEREEERKKKERDCN